jgi:polysaccharide pyruvyl transferase WcaK-like protein
MRIALLNVKYSPNLGDGLLSECLERELSATLDGACVFSIDIAGRDGFRPIAPSRRGHALIVLERLPGWLRALVVRLILTVLVHWRLQPHVARRLAGCNAAVVGGGNLFADADLNFPMKIAAALRAAQARDLPVAVFGVGASRGWSAAGSRLFSGSLRQSRLTYAAVRDTRSQQIWADQLSSHGIRPAELVRDPGLLASRHYSRSPASTDRRLVGLCITHPVALRYHAGDADQVDDLAPWYSKVATALVAVGFRVALFTNGSPEDRDYLTTHGPAWVRQAKGPVTITNAFATPTEMVAFISGCDVVVAHRMHACIAAHSFGIPTVGLRWDVKLDSFFAVAGRTEYMADPAAIDGSGVANLTMRALAEGIDATRLHQLLESARADVARLGEALMAATGVAPRAEAA